MGGAHSIAQGLRSGTLFGIWQGYVSALVFKAPLICLPAAFLMLLLPGDTFPCLFAEIPILFALGVAAYSLFRNCLPAPQAAAGAALLATMPMVTGLTHRFYGENLLLLLIIIYLDLLVRQGWRTLKGSALLGLVLGLGVLTKITFMPLVFLPSLYVFGLTVWQIFQASDYRSKLGKLVLHSAVMCLLAFVIAWSWYFKNWQAVMQHSRGSFSCALVVTRKLALSWQIFLPGLISSCFVWLSWV